MTKYHVTSTEKLFEGFVFDVERRLIATDQGEITRDIVTHAPCVCIIPIKKDGTLLMGKEYRSAIHRVDLSFPAGFIDGDEEILVAANRELEEELGYKAGKLEYLFHIGSSVGFTDEIVHVVLATDLEVGNKNFDDDEYVELVEMSLEDATNKVFTGEIISAPAVASLMYLNTKFKK